MHMCLRNHNYYASVITYRELFTVTILYSLFRAPLAALRGLTFTLFSAHFGPFLSSLLLLLMYSHFYFTANGHNISSAQELFCYATVPIATIFHEQLRQPCLHQTHIHHQPTFSLPSLPPQPCLNHTCAPIRPPAHTITITIRPCRGNGGIELV